MNKKEFRKFRQQREKQRRQDHRRTERARKRQEFIRSVEVRFLTEFEFPGAAEKRPDGAGCAVCGEEIAPQDLQPASTVALASAGFSDFAHASHFLDEDRRALPESEKNLRLMHSRLVERELKKAGFTEDDL